MKKSKPTFWWIALVNCLIAICALLIKDTITNQTVTTVCTWVLFAAWVIQGAYIFSKPKRK